MAEQNPLVGVLMGSKSDLEVMQTCVDQLLELEIPHEVRILSAHRTPEATRDYAITAVERGLLVLIAGAGWAAHLAGAIAAQTTLPVIGVPIDSSSLNGLDALLATVQMPPGTPVATVALGKGGAKNAAILATQMIGLKLPEVAARFKRFRAELTRKALEQSRP